MTEIKKNKPDKLLEKAEMDSEENLKIVLRENYFKIIEKLKEFCDLREDNYPIISLWVLGTYFHKQFETYPYLFFNAMKGSGKSKVLRLLSFLTYSGEFLVDLTEASLFRTASEHTLFVDECEDIGNKDKNTLRTLLNAGYKKGAVVKRMRQVGQNYEPETFDLFCPIAMANITGMESVLSDRCISLILEKSSNPVINRLQENFSDDDEIKEIVSSVLTVCSVILGKAGEIYKLWNNYAKTRYVYNNSTNSTNIEEIHINNSTDNSTKTLPNNSTKYDELFDKIGNSRLSGRVLELFFPLFILAYFCGNDVLDNLIKISETIVSEKGEEDTQENKDVALLDFISRREAGVWEFINDLLSEFKRFYDVEEEEAKTINNKWLGRALKRLVLKRDSRKIEGKSQVLLDTQKAKRQFRICSNKNE